MKSAGSAPVTGNPSPVGQFCLQNAGGAGAEEDADALFAVFFDSSAHCLVKAILHQSHQREPVVAAIKVGQLHGQLHRIHP